MHIPTMLLTALLLTMAIASSVRGAERLCWTDDSGNIVRANSDGSGVANLFTGLSGPAGIALDIGAGKMYWTEWGDKIVRANLDGSGAEDLVTTGLNNPYGMALDMGAGKMYWAEWNGNKIACANLDGTGVTDLVTGLSNPTSVALDGAGKMYYTEYWADKIVRANLDGSDVTDLVTGRNRPIAIALDVGAGKMYWTELSSNKIARANLDGTGDEDLVTGLSAPIGIALDAGAGKMYWAESSGNKIACANLDGSGVTNLATGLNPPTFITAPADIPGVQASAVNFTSPADTSLTVNWTRGDGDSCIVLMREGGAVNTDPADGTDNSTYTADTAFGGGTEIGTGNFVIYKGTGSSVSVTGLTTTTAYHVAVYEFTGSGGSEDYRTPAAVGDASTVGSEPGTPATPDRMVSSAADTMTLEWTAGSGANRIVLMREGGAVDQAPADGQAYTADAAFGSGDEIGTGNFVVYNGSGTSVTVTGLTGSTEYHIAVYEYDGSGGTENYDSGATLSGNTAMPAPGNALQFDGSDDYAAVPSSGTGVLGDNSLNENLTVEAVFYWMGGGGDSIVSKHMGPPNRGYVLAVSTGTGEVACALADGSLYYSVTGPVVSTNTWYHAAMTYTAATKAVELFLNGVSQGTVTVAGTPAFDGTHDLRIGSSEGYNDFFRGKIDEVRIWNTVRSEAQIRAGMNQTLVGNESGLVAYYRSDQTSGTTLYDLTANANDGTLGGGPAWTDSAAFNIWTGDTDTDWGAAGNWTDGVPAASSNVHIPSGGNQPEITAAAACDNLTIDTGATLTLSAGQLDVKGNLFSSGTVSGAGILVCSGTSAQTMKIGSVGNLIISNADGVTTEGALTVTGTLALTAGDLTLGGNLTVSNGDVRIADGGIIPDGNTVSYSGTTTLEYSGAGPYTATDNEFPASSGPTSLTVNSAGGVTLHADRTVTDLTLANGAFILDANTLTVNGAVSVTSGTLTGGATSGMVFGGTGDTTLPAVILQSLTLNRAGSTVTLGGNVSVEDTLTLSAGLLSLDVNDLTLGESAVIAGSPSVSAMILADGTGSLVRHFPDGTDQALTFLCPVGSDSGTPEYSPVTLDFTDGDFSSAYLSVRLSDTQYAVNDSPADYLERFWTVTQNGGITDFSCDLTFAYAGADVQGTETEIYGKRYAASAWTTLGQAGGNQFTGTVTEFGDFTGADHAPAVASPLSDLTVSEDADPSSVSLAGLFSDFDDDDAEIVISVSGNTDTSLVSADISGDTLTLTYTADGNGPADITVRGTTLSGKTADDTFTVTVNPADDAPTVANSIADVTVTEDGPDTVINLGNVFTDIDSDNAAIAKSVQSNSNPSLVSANADGNTLTLSYGQDQNGSAEITVRGSVDGKSAQTTFTVLVEPADDPPAVANEIADVTADEDADPEVISLADVFTDVDSDVSAIVRTVAENTNPSLVTAEAEGDTLTLTYAADQSGEAVITLQAESDGQTVLTDFAVTVNPVDDAPVASGSVENITVDEDAEDTVISLSDVFTDPDSDVITTSVTDNSNPALVSAVADGDLLTLSFQPDQNGEAVITFQGMADGKSAETSLFVTVTPADDPPTVANAIGDITADEDAEPTVIPLANVFTDIDSDISAIAKTVLTNTNPDLLTAEIIGDNLTLTYLPDQNGEASVTLQAESDGLTADHTFTVTVAAVDDPLRPVSDGPAEIRITVGEAETVVPLTDLVTDPDSDISGLSATDLTNSDPSLLEITSEGASLILSSVSEELIGQAEVTITVTSGDDTVTLTFTVRVAGEFYGISGKLTCFGAGLPLPGVRVIAEGTDFYEGLPVSLATVTDENGIYGFADVIRGNYTLTPLPDDDPGPEGLSADDATNIARASIGAYDLDAFQRRVADVTGNGDISGLDASRLIQYANSLRPSMSDDPDAPRWMSDPAAAEIILEADVTDQNFVIARAGDISGNWSPGGTEGTRSPERASAEIVLTPGSRVSVPVVLGQETEIGGIDLVAEFDSDVLEVADVTLAGGILEDHGYKLVANTGNPGQISLGIWCPCPELLIGSGTILFLDFDVVGTVGESTLLTLTRFDCNERPVAESARDTDSELSGGLETDEGLFRTLRISAGIPYDDTAVAQDQRVPLGDAIRALSQGDMAAAISVLRILTGQASGETDDL